MTSERKPDTSQPEPEPSDSPNIPPIEIDPALWGTVQEGGMPDGETRQE